MRTFTLPLLLLPLLLGNTDCGGAAEPSQPPDDSVLTGGSSFDYPSPSQDDCFPIAPLTCGQTVEDDTADTNAGTTDVVDSWSGIVGLHTGPEIAYELDVQASGRVTVSLQDARPSVVDHDLLLLDAALGCRSDAVVATGFNAVTADVVGGHRYYVVVDGYNGDAGPFSVSVGCDSNAIAPPPPSIEPTPSDEAEECAFGEGSYEVEYADWLAWEEMVEQYASAESMTALRRDQLRAGWAEATLSQDPADVPFTLAGPQGVWVDTITLDATGERFEWLRFRQDGFIPWGWIFRAGTTDLVAHDLDTGWMTCTVERP